VPKYKIRRLYETDARGIYDAELIDEVGYGLLARCQAFLDAEEARAGRAKCPACGAIVAHSGDRAEVLRCPCGWTLTWGDYFATIQGKQLSGAEPVRALFRDYVARFSVAPSPRAKMLLIDHLLHGFHWYYKDNTPTRPVAINLIEGRLRDVIAFLDALTYGQESTPGTREAKDRWDERIVPAKRWGRPRESDPEP
jgi:hypothetical protein